MRAIRLLLIPFVLLLGLIGVSQVHAGEPNTKSYLFEGKLGANGVLTVTETIESDAPLAELTQRIANHAPFDRNHYCVYDIFKASTTGAENFTSKVGRSYTVLSMKPSAEMKITYKVTGTTCSEPGSNGEISVFTWHTLQGLSVGAGEVSGSLQVDAMAQLVGCTVGPLGALEKYQLYTAGVHNSSAPKLESATRGADGQMIFTVGFSADQATATVRTHEQRNLDRAFTMDLAATDAALAAPMVGALLLWWLHRHTGADLVSSDEASAVGSLRPMGDGESVFEPDEGMRPGLMGTIADERVNPVDITTTLTNLVVHGHLRIIELQYTRYGLVDWQFSRLESPVGELLPYGSQFLNAVVPGGGHSLASQLPEVLTPTLGQVQDALYDEVIEHGWFETHPDSTRSSWAMRG